jgi:hypothetical protein
MSDPQVDRMSLVGRWWLIVGPDGHAFEVRDEQPDPILGHGQPFKDRVVEVVPADQLRGAVEVRDAATDLLRVLDKYDAEPVVAVNAIDRLRAAITATGGQ